MSVACLGSDRNLPYTVAPLSHLDFTHLDLKCAELKVTQNYIILEKKVAEIPVISVNIQYICARFKIK